MSHLGRQLPAFEESHVALLASLGLLGFESRLMALLEEVAPAVTPATAGEMARSELLPAFDPFLLALLGAIGFLQGAENTLHRVAPENVFLPAADPVTLPVPADVCR